MSIRFAQGRPRTNGQPSLTIVLPVNNAEGRLQDCVSEILDLASDLTPDVNVVIIDDGSTDDTFDVAEELAARYPQISVQRHRHTRGLGAAIDFAERSVRADVVIVHDGVTPIEPDQVRHIWQSCVAQSDASHIDRAAERHADWHELAKLPSLHATMAAAHQRMLGFQVLTPASRGDADGAANSGHSAGLPQRDIVHRSDRHGVGQIPALPRPKFLTALADFALGE